MVFVTIVVIASHFYFPQNFILKLLCGFLLAGVFAVFLARSWAEPLQTVTADLQSMVKDKEFRKVHLPREDELGELVRTLNEVQEETQRRLDDEDTRQSRFAAVLLSMTEGVMVLDREGIIVLMNQTLRDFLKISYDPTGCRLLEVIRNITIEEISEKVLHRPHKVESKEITLLLPEERVLWVHASAVIRDQDVDGAVLVFHDITELRRLERIRQDFVANVSHELRTPLTTIKGYAETLLDGALEDKSHAKDFLHIIHSDAERLTKIVNELLDLSSVESGKMRLSFNFCSLYDIVERVLHTLRPMAQEKLVTLLHHIPRQFSAVWADEACLAQILLNLIENAVKYNKPNGSVTVSAREENNRIVIDVADTGIGIPPEDLSRIFERFYRVDKAHSRQLGGTGLGLSIVKHMAQAIHGEISVVSTLNQGSIFSLNLPHASPQ
jgi:two-component system phosphate regulon sensor histidine kinase PhoR